ncbi:toprim domain-containing protein [Aneurinibacillus sp. Ricciae_BoGa-3]|uniref:toprim domain-containing protein n=1 Tax=Aneurinibacillus sp. Ricciae_BoGa-3 TaxID=3022697 RepID=UPI002340FD99|nr:toprim domain-containing protein [Aneurinibacillus sp. Ricciae_BoGa-3]WCK54038.1 toprim domain-containing protein [Aneurinibacillus sp. Ricciae_BoGa-3]
MIINKVIIVEGKTDKKKLEKILAEPVEIICTHGTLSSKKIEDLYEKTGAEEVFIFVDEDSSGKKLRSQLKHEFPNAHHLYTRRSYAEIARTPYEYLAKVLRDAYFQIDESAI